MSRPTRSTDVRKAAINASTVFAVTLAIIAGLICAWVFKTVFLAPKKTIAAPPPPTYRVTVMAANLTEDMAIGTQQVKRITVDEATYKDFKAKEKDKGEILTGNQPVGRHTKEPLRAEEPVYANQVKDLKYPVEISKLLEPGKVAAIVEVPTRNTMARVNDHVDLLCTLTNSDPDLGPTETRTAVMAKNVKVVARFNTTKPDAQPSRSMSRSDTRPYTLEVTPYRYGMIELAKQLGAAFALRIHSREETGLATTVAAKGEEAEDPNPERVTTDDLVKLFGFSRPLPPKYFEIEKFTGVDQGQSHMFLQPGSPAPSTKSQGGGRRGGGGLQGPNRSGGGGKAGGGGGGGGAGMGGGGGGQRPGGGGMGGGGGGQRPGGGGGGGGGGNRQASSMGSSNNSLSVDTGLTESGWRRVASNEAGSGGRGKAGNRQTFGGASAMSNSRGVGGLSSGGGGLSGPSGSRGGANNLGGVSASECKNCGKKRGGQ